MNDESYYAVRASLLYQGNDRSDWRLTLDYRNLDQSPLAFETTVANPPLEYGLPAFPGGSTFQFATDGNPRISR